MKICLTASAVHQTLAGAGLETSITMLPLVLPPSPADLALLQQARRLTDRLVVALPGPQVWLDSNWQQQLQRLGVDVVVRLAPPQPCLLAVTATLPFDGVALLQAIMAVLPQAVWANQAHPALVTYLHEILRLFPGLFVLETRLPTQV